VSSLSGLFCDRRLGVERWYASPPLDYLMRVPDDLLKCVVFVGRTVADASGARRPRYEGTAFFVGMPSERVPEVMFTYLVTAAHVADMVEADFWIRQNRGDQGAVMVRPGDGDRWTYHPNGKVVDVAVMSWPMPADMDHVALPTEMMLGNPQAFVKSGIGVGDEVFLMGVFPTAYGVSRNTPIVRKGNIAMLPEDKVRTKMGDMDAYIIEAHSLGGISGSPIFARETIALAGRIAYNHGEDEPVQRTMQTAGTFYLLGLMHGHWQLDPADVDSPYWRTPTTGQPVFHIGLSVVVPAVKILETLNHPELVSHRKQAEEAMVNSRSVPTPDSSTATVVQKQTDSKNE
jgi:hypothetical protein